MTHKEEIPTKTELEVSNRSLQLFLIVFVVGMLLGNLPEKFVDIEQIAYSSVISILVMLGIANIASSRKEKWLAGVLGLAGVSSHWLHYYMASTHLAILETAINICFFYIFFSTVLRRVFHKGDVDVFKIEGAIVAYFTIALIMGNIFTLIELIFPGSFQISSGNLKPDIGILRKNLIYFSFTNITTLGLGDIIPLNPIARTLTALEASIGVLFPNILIARLVSLEIIHSQGK